MKLLQSRSGKLVEVTLSDDTELSGKIGEVSSDNNGTAFELKVVEEYEDGSEEEETYIINWSDLRYLRDVRPE